MSLTPHTGDSPRGLLGRRYNKGIPDAKQKELVWLENRRTHKWVKMIGKQLEDWEVYVSLSWTLPWLDRP
jgi:hypothetical protein